MNKMQIAHDMALELVKIKPSLSAWQIADRCFEYADAMQAEADKREDKTRPEVLKEWQPDWSQAPNGALSYHIELDELDGGIQPFWTDSLETYFDGEMFVGYKCAWNAPSFGYTGNWQDSLRKRPQ